MTVTTEVSRATFDWTGVETSFACGFPALAAADLDVFFTTPAGATTTLVLGVNYDVSLASGTRLATVTPLVIPAAEGTISIERSTPATVLEVLTDGQEYSLEVIQLMHDRAALIAAEYRTALARALRLPPGIELGNGNFDLQGSGFSNVAPGVASTDAATVGQLLDLIIASGNVPVPLLADAGKYLKATGAGAFSWQDISLALTLFSAGFFTANAEGRAKFAAGFVSTTLLADKAATLAKLQDIGTGRILGRVSPLSGIIEELDAAQVLGILGLGGLPAGHITGLTLSNNVIDATNDIDIAPGKARSGDDTDDIVLAAALTKRLDAAWAAGSGNGGLDTGTIANGWYHVHAIKRPDTGAVCALFSLSATAPTLPANYTKFRRIGAIWRMGGAIKAFIQAGNQFLWTSSVRDVSSGTPGNLPGTYYTLSVPPGVQVEAIVSALTIGSALSYNKLRSPDQTASIASATDFDAASDATTTLSNIQVERRTDATARLFASCSSSATTMSIITHGWNDPL
jgi:hypothetical protein